MSPLAARWHKVRHILAAAVAMTCVFSTGVLWATHRSEMVADFGGQPTEFAAAVAESISDGDATPGQPIRNTPVLIREGETRTTAAGLAAAGWAQGLPPLGLPMAPGNAPASVMSPITNGSESAQSTPVAPITPIVPVVRVVPVVPIAPSTSAAQADAAASPGRPAANRLVSPSPLDRDGLTELAARPAEPSAHAHAPKAQAAPQQHAAKADKRPKRRQPAGRRAPAVRVASAPAQSRGAAPKVARGRVPTAEWEMRRQGLRSEPEPEPSTLKKLIGYVWPFGKSSTSAEPAKPVVPAVTAHPYSWSDSTRARP
ncbi:MAG: hypothetical protein ABI391_04990 [Hyphomicrobiaceae bacterium]